VLKRAIVAFCAVFAMSVSAVPALADAPFGPTVQVTDRVGALNANQLKSVQAALASLYAKDRVKLFITYVKNFSGVNPSSWADQSATLAGMGQRDVLLGIATQDRQYAVSTDTGFSLSTKQLDDVAATAIEPALRESDWAGAAIGAANGYAAVLAGQPIPAPTITPGNATAGAKSGSGAGVFIAVIAIIALLALFAFFFLRRRRPGGQPATAQGPPALTLPQLEAKAGHLLVATDDAIKTSEQELGFASAQFGDEAIEPFTKAMESAKSELAAAFKLRQLLDDDIPEDDPTKRRMLEELCAHCETANKLLDEQATAFDKLRNLEANAPQIIEQITASAQQQQGKLAVARATLAQLTAQYAPSATAPVAQNAEEAASRLVFLQSSLAQAQQAVTSGDNSRAAVLAQAAQLADDQATQLLEGIDRRAGELSQASAALGAALGAVDANVAEAAASAQPGLREPAVQAQMVATQVRTAMAGGPVDPLEALRALEESSSRLDQALSGAREEQVRQQRARAALEQAVLTARSSIAAAADFITTNRGGVGSTARTRVAEAHRHLERALALAGTDAESALAEAQQADSMATQAYQEAQQDVSGFAGAGSMFGGGGGSGGGMGGMAGAVLGGILINSIFGGAGGGSRGGSGRAAPPAAGSYGGASTRGRHSVGGKF
jgi:MYXO-CTERM domain-containing protein